MRQGNCTDQSDFAIASLAQNLGNNFRIVGLGVVDRGER